MPEMESRRTFNNPALAEVRMMPVKGFEKYPVFYHSSPEGVEIMRIVHGAGDLPALFGKCVFVDTGGSSTWWSYRFPSYAERLH